MKTRAYIHFAIAPRTPLPHREVARELVAERFRGIAETTELVSVENYGRLYRMERA